MPEPTKGSETTEEIITTPAEAIKAGEDGPSEEKETPAPSSGDTPDESSEEEKPADETEETDEELEKEEAEEGEADPAEAGEGEPEGEAGSEGTEGEDGDGSPDLSDGGKNAEDNLKRAPGETPKEYALRREVTRLKRINRTQRVTKLLGDVQPQKAAAPAELSAEEKKVLESFDPEQVANQEKLFGILAKKNGYVRKDELTQGQYKDTAQTVLDDWLGAHPQYSEEKDPDGILWKRFGEEFGMYKPPANPKDHVKIFNRIHNDIFGITTKEKAGKDLKTVKAQQKKVDTASAGSGGSAPRKLSDRRKSAPADKELSDAARSGGLKGFSDQEIADMGL